MCLPKKESLLRWWSHPCDFRFPRPRPGNPKHLEPNPLHFMEYAPMPGACLACLRHGFLRPPGVAMAYWRYSLSCASRQAAALRPSSSTVVRPGVQPARPFNTRGTGAPTLPQDARGRSVRDDPTPFSALAGEPLSAQDFRGFPGQVAKRPSMPADRALGDCPPSRYKLKRGSLGVLGSASMSDMMTLMIWISAVFASGFAAGWFARHRLSRRRWYRRHPGAR
jgi:hypothetical protein